MIFLSCLICHIFFWVAPTGLTISWQVCRYIAVTVFLEGQVYYYVVCTIIDFLVSSHTFFWVAPTGFKVFWQVSSSECVYRRTGILVCTIIDFLASSHTLFWVAPTGFKLFWQVCRYIAVILFVEGQVYYFQPFIIDFSRLPILGLTLSMPRLLSSKAQGRKDFLKTT